MDYSFFELIWIFIIYAFIGWCIEVITATIQNRKFINRGFLNGPFCPIYGFVVIAVLVLLTPLRGNLLIFFISSILLVTFIEFITGYVLEKSFHQKWWDYTDEKFNINGYVCLQASIIWGVACIFVVYILEQPIGNFTDWISGGMGNFVAIFIIFILIIDTIVTILSLFRLKQKIRLLKEIGDRIEILSDAIGKNISDDIIIAMKITDDPVQELNNLKKKYHTILDKRIFGHARIVKAFPKLDIIKPKKIENKSKRRIIK